MPELLILSTSASTRLMVGMLSRAAAHEHDALHDVVVVVVAGDAEARQVADRAPGDVADQHRARRCWRSSSCCAMSSMEWIRPTPRTTADCGPILTVWPPTLMLALPIACSTCGKDRPYADQLVVIDVTS